MQKERLILLELLNILSNSRCQKIKGCDQIPRALSSFYSPSRRPKPQNAKEGYNKALDSDQDDALR
jgi:hypothetical protein